MSRRIINKAYNDIVSGTDAASCIGTNLPRKSSVLKLSCKEVSYGNRQAVEIKPINDRQVQRAPLQMALPLNRDNVKPEEKAGIPQFVNIDGDLSARQVEVQKPKTLPQTAYKMRSFMSTVELDPQRIRPPTQVNQNVVKPPVQRIDVPKVSNQPAGTAMFLPKGIRHCDQPYIVPKFMPPYREMMTPKPKPDPLVSIVERTPPSLQKWALEWNAEPKKTISIDELKEDLMREAAKKPDQNQLMPFDDPKANEMYEDRKQDQPDVIRENQPSHPEPIRNVHLNASANRTATPWNDLHIPASNDTTIGVQERKVAEPKQLKIGQPLVDWVPPKYIGSSRLSDPRLAEYSFQEAIKKGTPKTVKPESNVSPMFFRKPAENAVYFDTDEQKFHEWFKEKMSAAAQSAMNSSFKAMPKSDHPQIQTTQLNDNTFSAFKNSNKPSNVVTSANPSGQNHHTQADYKYIKDIIKTDCSKDVSSQPEVSDHPEPTDAVSATTYDAESNSSFFRWLKARSHHIIMNNEPHPKEDRKDMEKPEKLPSSRFPWSVSYTLRRRLSTPKCFHERPSASKRQVVPKKIASQDGIGLISLKNAKNPPKTVFRDDTTLSGTKHPFKKPVNSSCRDSFKSAGKTFKTNNKPYVKKKPSFVGKGPLKILTKKPSKPQTPVLPHSTDQLWLTRRWKVDSEIDHVNNLRKADAFGNSAEGPTSKRNLPLMGAPQMKYWELKYTKSPKGRRNQNIPSPVDCISKHNPHCFRSDKGNDGIVEWADSGADKRPKKLSFSSIEEHSSFPLELCQNTQNEIMDFSEDFDVDKFLHKEESVEKELLRERPQNNRTEETKEQPEKTESELPTSKVKGKEHIKFTRSVKLRNDRNDSDLSLKQRVAQKHDEDEFVLALGEDHGLEDLEWSEFIGPKNSLEHDTDLTRLIGSQARQLSSMQNSCL